MNTTSDNLILFDGLCHLCSSSVLFIIRHDKGAVFKFVPMQTERGRQLCQAAGFDTTKLETFLVFRQGLLFARSDAALEVVRHFGGLWRVLLVLKLMPRGWRDGLYALIVKNRYRWFGRREACMIPSADIKERFLT